MGFAALIMKGVTDTMGMVQSIEASKQEQKELEAQEAQQHQLAEEEKERGLREAEAIEISATDTARRQRLRDKKALERQGAFQAGSGISQTEGSPLKIDEQNQINSLMNINDIFDEGLNRGSEARYQSKLSQRSLLYGAEQLRYGIEGQKSQRKQVVKNFFAGMGASAVKSYAANRSSQQQQDSRQQKEYGQYQSKVNSQYRNATKGQTSRGGITRIQSGSSSYGGGYSSVSGTANA